MVKSKFNLRTAILLFVSIICFTLSAIGFANGGLFAKAQTIEYGTLSTTHLKVEKNTFRVGEPIFVTATEKNVDGKDWVGIGEKDKFSEGSILWTYISYHDSNYTQKSGGGGGFGSGVEFDIKLGKATSGYSGSSWVNIPAGEYAIFFATGDSASSASEAIYITVTANTVSNDYLKVTKTDFYEGEDILFTHNVTSPNSNDWVGICPENYKLGSIKWDYVNCSKGTNIVANDITQRQHEQYSSLPAGKYNLIYGVSDARVADIGTNAVITITVHAKRNCAKSTTHLSMEKTVFYAGEPIMVTPTGSDLAWVGIAKDYTLTSLRWKYITTSSSVATASGAGSGVAIDIRQAKPTDVAGDLANIPAGEYQIIYVENDGASRDATEIITITVISSKPAMPTSATLVLDNQTDGFINGDITVNFANYSSTISYKRPTDVIMYWADANGNRLAEYSSLAKRKVSSATTTFNTYDGVKIPENAQKLLVHGINSAGEVSDPYAITLPENSQYKSSAKLIQEFQIVSDVHITTDPNNDKTSHWAHMLNDVANNSKNSNGVFVVGDVVDTGDPIELQYMVSKYNELKSANSFIPEVYFTIGNHELMGGATSHSYPKTDAQEIADWMSYVKQINSTNFTEGSNIPYHERWINGIQCILLSTEVIPDRTNGAGYISDTQLAWLDDKLSSNTTGNPIMIMLHQPMLNTVAGSLEPYNWDNVVAGSDNMKYNSSEGAYQYRLNSKAQNEKPLRDILAKHGADKNVMLFTGHSHWYFDAEFNMVHGGSSLPITMFNTSSVGYLWNDYTNPEGEYQYGSQGYYIRVYEDRVEVLGRNFHNNTWASSAQFVVECDVTPDHEHDFSYDTEYDEFGHYGVCECGDIENKVGHSFINGECSCGYVDPNYVVDGGNSGSGDTGDGNSGGGGMMCAMSVGFTETLSILLPVTAISLAIVLIRRKRRER